MHFKIYNGFGFWLQALLPADWESIKNELLKPAQFYKKPQFQTRPLDGVRIAAPYH
jgi:hypothetical protein